MSTPHHRADQSETVPASFDECLTRQFALCAALETLADTLPLNVDTLAATRLAEALHPTLSCCQIFEETYVFPIIAQSGPQVELIVERLRHEHIEDIYHARDVCDSVKAFAGRRHRVTANEEGYMLRCLFTSLRRHLAFDRDYVMPLYLQVRGC
ncbi:hemerythrin domain-containing protein [uncultured Jannaschia sp.]|uniref:hemerythrin domain-containing protein n=1 Tax=uncultured Jannaschia sp. TaxID=293347 RepID=UPI002614A8E3|nr:hemerythrin domain-containing protein [uncultured Jannaschia sp.]